MATQTFTAHYLAQRPYPAWNAWRQWQKGVLTIGADSLYFRPPASGEAVTIDRILEVVPPWRTVARSQHIAANLVDTWIEVKYQSSNGTRSAFFNDARWWALGHYLSHKTLFRALEDFAAQPAG